MLPLLSCCLRLEGIHYIPGYRQLAKAIFQLCAFKELIGGEIILSRWRHNFSHLPWGLPVLKGGARQPGVSPGPHPGTGLHMGRCSPGEAHAGLGVPPAAHGGVPPLLRTGPGVALAVPLSRFLCTPFPSPPRHVFLLLRLCPEAARNLGPQTCAAQRHVPNSSEPALTRSRSCGDQAPRGTVAGPACAPHPRMAALPARPPA